MATNTCTGRRRTMAWVMGAAAALALCGAAWGQTRPAEEENAYIWKPRVTSVAVFKNGLGFFLRKGEARLRDGWCLSKEIPPAAFGTLAIYAYDPNGAVDVVGSGPGETTAFDGVDAPKDIAAKREALEKCLHLKVELAYKQKGADRTAAGKLLSVGPQFAILESDGGNSAVALEDIASLQVLELPIRVHVTGEGDKSPAKAELGMAYLRKGITWVPEYTLRVLDDQTAELTLRGTLVNEAEDLVHCDVQFVVGVPHFAHTGYMAPIAVGQMIRTIGAAVAPQEIQTQIMNRAALVTHQGRAMDVVAQPVDAAGDVAPLLGSLPQVGGAAATDYTVYTKKDLTVRRGEKAIVTLFRKKIAYGHIYRWQLPAAMEHSLVLRNATDTPWTTGPCLIVSDAGPLGEDILKYTPKGGSGEMPVTTAINLAQEEKTSEIDRKLKAHSPSRETFLDLVTVKGELTVRNFEKRAVKVIVSTPIVGKPLTASDDGRLRTDTNELRLTERKGTVEWTIELKPDETRTLTYTYERFVPSQ